MIFFTSDLHFGHANIIKYCNRPFKDVDEMNEELVRRWNSVVKPEDTVYVLGDFAMGPAENVVKYGSRLNGRKVLIPGNHDRCHAIMHKDKPQKKDYGYKLFTRAGFIIKDLECYGWIGDTYVKLHHMPYHSDHTQDVRHKEWRPKDEGDWLLHGHVHELWKVKDRMINVGVDVWDFYPVPITAIEKLIKSGESNAG